MTKEFNLNKKIADSGIQAFNCIKDKIGPEYARVISWTLTKLKLLEEQGAEILKADYDYINHPLHYTNGKKLNYLEKIMSRCIAILRLTNTNTDKVRSRIRQRNRTNRRQNGI